MDPPLLLFGSGRRRRRELHINAVISEEDDPKHNGCNHQRHAKGNCADDELLPLHFCRHLIFLVRLDPDAPLLVHEFADEPRSARRPSRRGAHRQVVLHLEGGLFLRAAHRDGTARRGRCVRANRLLAAVSSRRRDAPRASDERLAPQAMLVLGAGTRCSVVALSEC